MALLPSPGRVEHEDINLPKLIRVGKPQFNVAPTSAGTKLLVSSFLSIFLLTYPGSFDHLLMFAVSFYHTPLYFLSYHC